MSDTESPNPPAAKREHRLLLVLLMALVLVLILGGFHYVRLWRMERELATIGRALVDQVNREDPIPVSELGPEADVEISATCTFAYLFFGEPTGKVTLMIHPRPHAKDTRIGGVSYIYRLQNGVWKQTESYHE